MPANFLVRVAPSFIAPRPAGAALCLAGLTLALALAGGRTALAQAADPAAPDLGQLTQRWLDDALAHNPSAAAPAMGLPLRMQVHVGALDPRLRLAPCAQVQPYLPAGARLWGRTRLGLRCVAGGVAWNVFLPVTIEAFGPAWVLTRNLAPGSILTADDATAAEVDWAAQAAPVIAHPALWQGQVAVRPLLAGQALRQTMVRAPWLFVAGAQVQVLAQGPGYAVTAAGQALSAGVAGKTMRVRMDNGRIISGTVTAQGTVEAAP